MSKPLDISLTQEAVALRVGTMLIRIWQYERQIEVLEERVDELDGDGESAHVGSDEG